MKFLYFTRYIYIYIYTELVRCNQIDDALNISTPTACQDTETRRVYNSNKYIPVYKYIFYVYILEYILL